MQRNSSRREKRTELGTAGPCLRDSITDYEWPQRIRVISWVGDPTITLTRVSALTAPLNAG